MTYSLVESRDSITIAALNNLNIMACDIENAYLMAKCQVKCWTAARSKFGSEAGLTMIINKALFGLKSPCAAFRAHVAERLDPEGYKPSYADPDVWLRPAVKPDGFKYYKYIRCYLDNMLCKSADPKEIDAKDPRGLQIGRRQDCRAGCLSRCHNSEDVTWQWQDMLDYYIARTICKGCCHQC